MELYGKMKNNYKILKRVVCSILFLFSIQSNTGYSQETNSTEKFAQSTANLDENLLYSFVILSDNSGNYIRGFLLDVKVDTLVILSDNQTKNIPIKDLNSITIETQESLGTEGAVIGAIMGTYLFYAAFWQTEEEPFAYYDMNVPGAQLFLSVVVGAFLGSGIGYLIGISAEGDTETFYLSGNDEDKRKEYKRLDSFLSGNGPTSKLHMYFQLSQVSTRLSEEANNINLSPYGYDHPTSFNLVRKIQITYSISNEFEVGGAICWFGEPRVGWNSNSSNSYSFSSAIHSFEGVGYYALAVYNPFKLIFPKSLSLNFGLGVGTGNVKYKFVARPSEYYWDPYNDTTIVNLDKNLFSALFYTQLDLFLYDNFSMGFIADYVYIPEIIPGIPELDISSRSLGNFSFGLTLGLHF